MSYHSACLCGQVMCIDFEESDSPFGATGALSVARAMRAIGQARGGQKAGENEECLNAGRTARQRLDPGGKVSAGDRRHFPPRDMLRLIRHVICLNIGRRLRP
jgi:hypothetical protein